MTCVQGKRDAVCEFLHACVLMLLCCFCDPIFSIIQSSGSCPFNAQVTEEDHRCEGESQETVSQLQTRSGRKILWQLLELQPQQPGSLGQFFKVIINWIG